MKKKMALTLHSSNIPDVLSSLALHQTVAIIKTIINSCHLKNT